DSAYRQRMSRRKEIDPEGYRIYGLGEWGETEGLILTNWKVKDISQNMNFYDDISVGQDFGYNHANVILVLGFRDGALYILRELYVQEKDTDEIIRMATEIPKDRLMYCDSAEPDRIRMWRRAGFRAQAVCKEPGSISAQIDWLKARPILIHPDCTNTIREISQWKWKKDSYSGLYLDEPEAIQDDAMAALRYGIEGQRKGKGIRILK
ncbi:MAG TPA: PBSX family phage terminase large subunit, partial [Firmicutes bacterium]|nr:PBSX family phage terminase large subunit [Bacillota bacterium]